MTPGLSKDILCQVCPYFSKLANHHIRHQSTHKVGWASLVIVHSHLNLPVRCDEYRLTGSLYQPWGLHCIGSIKLTSYYKSSSVCLFVCLSVCSLSPPRSFDRSSPNLVGVCRWTSELPLRGSFSKRSTARRVNGSLSLSTILYMCQPHSTQLQKATLLLLHLIRLKGTFCCIDGWWVYVGGSRNWLLDGSSMACK